MTSGMGRKLIHSFWNCGDGQIIEYAMQRARLNSIERIVLTKVLDDCLTQEKIAEQMGYSTRRIQDYWYSATSKMLNIPWVYAYAKELSRGN